MEKSYNALVHYSYKNTAANFDLHATDVVSKLLLTRTLSVFPCGCLGVISSWMCGVDCWPVPESGTENILVSDSSSESLRPP